MVKSKHSNLIVSLKMLNIDFIKNCAITSGIVITNYCSQIPFHYRPSPNYLDQKNTEEIL